MLNNKFYHSKFQKKTNEILEYISSFIPKDREVGIILGSGWDGFTEILDKNYDIISYDSIPHFPKSTTDGHYGKIFSGTVCGKKVLIFQGRFHYYEGYGQWELSLIPQIIQHMGAKILISTNSSGGVNPKAGSLVVLKDHINMLPINPLRGQRNSFVDMSEAYSKRLIMCAKKASEKVDVELTEGILAALMGPSYETPAEVRFLRAAGADIVSMSMVPEVISAKYLGIEVLGISCVANKACTGEEPSIEHETVLKNVRNAQSKFIPLVREILKIIYT